MEGAEWKTALVGLRPGGLQTPPMPREAGGVWLDTWWTAGARTCEVQAWMLPVLPIW